ncbi:gamma-glutamylcyclotransferase family protein [Emcibacter sp. SYSU 3D8]|uniref:gamma-glutamylcyclotransferase family protein n=1 Tax=Emcibacter sp. SYSU 3D8 TaxID=3133969 RepID=UPI0031FEA8AE
MTRLYFAYGRNMHPVIMAQRCPAAGFIGAASLPDYRLLINIRGVSTVVPEAGATVHGVLWRLTQACEAALDEIEGVARGSYRRATARPVADFEVLEPALIYIASNAEPSLPREGYLESLEEAALHHGFPEAYRLYLSGLRTRP